MSEVPRSKSTANGEQPRVALRKPMPAAQQAVSDPMHAGAEKPRPAIKMRPEVSQLSVTGAPPNPQTPTADDRSATATASPAAQAVKPNNAQANGLEMLLNLEAEARQATNEKDLLFSMANTPRRMLGFRQAMVFRFQGGSRFKVEAIASLAAVDRGTPLVRWAEQLVYNLHAETGGKKSSDFLLPAYCDPSDPDTTNYPFRSGLYVPLIDRSGELMGAMLMMRETVWNEGDLTIANRLGQTYAHAWQALSGGKPVRKSIKAWHAIRILSAVAILVGAFIPIPLSTLAPVEVAARDPLIIAAPLDGIIGSIPVAPNSEVKAGDIVLQLNDTDLRNKLDIANRDVEVAEAKVWRANQAAFSDRDAKRELAVLKAELRLRVAEAEGIAAELERTIIRAPRDGVLLYKDKRDLVGKPVSTGERIMRLANPDNVEFRIDLPVADAILIDRQAEVRVFLDTDPLNAIEAKLNRSSYHAQPTADQTLAYKLSADPVESNLVPLRVGARGSAKLVGDDVPLYFYLLRKPIAMARQWTGY